MNRGEYDRLISSLGKRVFLLHNVHEKKPQLFQTRWAMNYLAGPLTRSQIPAVNQLTGAKDALIASELAPQPTPATVETAAGQSVAAAAPPQRESEHELPGSTTRPAVPGRMAEYFLPNDLSFTEAFSAAGRSVPEQAQSLGLIYRPALLAQSRIRYLNRKYDLDFEQENTALTRVPDRRGVIRWEEILAGNVDVDSIDDKPDPRARFGSLEAPLSEPKTMKSMESDFLDWNYHNSSVVVRANEDLDIYCGPQVSHAEFRKMCTDAAREKREAELDKVADRFDKKVDTVVARMKREERELEEDRSDLSQRKMEEYGTHAETVLSLFGRRKKSLSRSLSKRRMTEKAEADVKESLQAIEEYERQIKELQAEQEEALDEVNEHWEEIASQVSEIEITPYKKDIQVELFGVAWFPYYLVQIGDQFEELEGIRRNCEKIMNLAPWVILFAVVVYGFVHSLLATLGVKARARQWLGSSADRWYRLAYNFFGIVTFLPILGLVAAYPGELLYLIPAPWSYLTLAGQLIALVALGIGLLQTGIWSFLGFEQMLVDAPTSEPEMVTGGLYRWVRHPLYTAGLVFIWLTPVMTSGLLALNIGLTIYLVVGAYYEERKLVREFGEAYTRYQLTTPMLIPGLIRRRPGSVSRE